MQLHYHERFFVLQLVQQDISFGLCRRVSGFEVSSRVLPSVAIEFVPEIKPHDDDRTGIQRGQWLAVRPSDIAFFIFGRVDVAATSADSGSFGGEHVLCAAPTSAGSINSAERVLSAPTASVGSNSLG